MLKEPHTIGPYRMLHRLGLGGMGEVWLAHDQRLDRRVAIKRIRTEVSLTDHGRERFEREARLAAQLNHPAIVQVYDVLREEDSSSIVMEYVAGGTLKSLAESPLSVARILGFARQIADGLMEAHEQGIVHRDLKTENVLVTPKGDAKVTDFGIAKRLSMETASASITAEGAVLGTYRAMSPEQASGEAVDHRTDLFSFGVLLYELLTGQTPFACDNLLQTLNRILFHHPPLITELNPAVPDGLSVLVDQLLQKDPWLRPASAHEVGAALERLTAGLSDDEATHLVVPAEMVPGAVARLPVDAPTHSEGRFFSGPLKGSRWAVAAVLAVVVMAVVVLAIVLAAALIKPWWPPREPLYVAVPKPVMIQNSGEKSFDLVASGMREALLRGLISLQGISVKDPAEVDAVAGPSTVVAQAVAADEVVTSELDCRGKTCRARIHRIRGGSVLWTESFEIPSDDYALAATAVVGTLRRGYPNHRTRPGSLDLQVASADLEEFLLLRREFNVTRAAEPKFLERLTTLRDRAPRFPEIYLLESEVGRRRFLGSRDSAHLDQVFNLLAKARELTPGDPRVLNLLVRVALDAGQFDRAEQALDQLEILLPGDVHTRQRRALLLEGRGKTREAIKQMRASGARQPSWWWLHSLARMEYHVGEIAAAREHLEDLLVRSPGNYQGLSLLAQLELVQGDPARAIELYRQLVAQVPGPVQLTNLGLAYLLQRRYTEAAEVCRQAHLTEPGNPFFALNLADVELLLGQENAPDLYRRVIELTKADPNSSHWQMLTVRAQALAHLGEHRRAVAAVQEALRQAPESNQVAYEAALIYALIGETASALVNAERALELGYGTRWFSFPWFDALRKDPEFIDLLSAAYSPDR
jgi:serine/threonine-protein kinase